MVCQREKFLIFMTNYKSLKKPWKVPFNDDFFEIVDWIQTIKKNPKRPPNYSEVLYIISNVLKNAIQW